MRVDRKFLIILLVAIKDIGEVLGRGCRSQNSSGTHVRLRKQIAVVIDKSGRDM
jgi:hypothetical protein